MKHYKRFLALSAAAAMAVSLAACGSGGSTNPSSAEDGSVNTDPIQIATKPMTEQYISAKCSSRSSKPRRIIPAR